MMVLGTPAICALFGLFCGYFAVGLGRDPYRWFLLGTLTGPIGFLVLFMPPVRKADFCLSCRACNQIVHIGDRFCRYCGVRVEDTLTKTAADRCSAYEGEMLDGQ